MLEISCVRLNNQLKGNKYTSFTKVRVHGVHFEIFTTCSPLYVATIAAYTTYTSIIPFRPRLCAHGVVFQLFFRILFQVMEP